MALLNFHRNHKVLVTMSIGGFLFLSILIAILPAYQMQSTQPMPTQEPLTELERAGLEVYVAEGCVACHTQQVRNIEMDAVWGSRPSMPSDYYYSKDRLDVWRQSPSLLGSERTGPDLTDIGNRQSSADWHLLHLYNPRTVVSESIMPSYKWLFETVDSAEVDEDDVVVPVGKEFFDKPGKKVVAGEEALQLVAYLQSLKQPDMPGEQQKPFIPAKKKSPLIDGDMGNISTGGGAPSLPDGANLYATHCAACHQPSGKGIQGAFPPLAGSDIVNDPDHSLLIKIILQGYDARSDYGVMAAFASVLTDDEIAAIATHERSSWGNDAPAVTAEDVKAIRSEVMNQADLQP